MKVNKKYILNYLDKNKMTKQEFCKKCEFSYKTLSKILGSDIKGIRAKSIVKICQLLDISADDFLCLK